MKYKIFICLIIMISCMFNISFVNNVQASEVKDYEYLSLTIPGTFSLKKEQILNNLTDIHSEYWNETEQINFIFDTSTISEDGYVEYDRYSANSLISSIGNEWNPSIIGLNLNFTDHVRCMIARYKEKTTDSENTYYHYDWYIKTDHAMSEFKFYSKNQEIYDSKQITKLINSIILKDTVANTRITPFKDVQMDSWYYNAVKYNWQNNIVNGLNKYTFAPNNRVTRGMIVTMLYAMAGISEVKGVCKFTDVESTKYYYNAMRWASENKIVNGYAGTTKFGPEDYVTREQLAVMLTSYATYQNKYQVSNVSLDKFSDSDNVSSWALPAIRWAVENKVINGTKNGNLNARGYATRAEVVTMLYSYYLNIK